MGASPQTPKLAALDFQYNKYIHLVNSFMIVSAIKIVAYQISLNDRDHISFMIQS